MPYIPKEHEKYDVLPRKRKNGGEAFDYPSKMLFQIEEIIGHDLTPYGYESYEEYYKEVDTCAEPFKDDPVVTKLFVNYKAEVMRMNRKEEWSICKYKGDRIGEIMGLESGHTYYWPTTADNPVYCGVIDEEEFTNYWFPTETEDWEILLDPTGMAYRTLYEKKGYVSRKNFDYVMKQARELLDNRPDSYDDSGMIR